jgi:alpha-amylase/alpha-mannosidase (GH57 family)
MPKIYLTFVWHMHQPCYKDLVSGEYRLPWTRMHALKDYYGMVKILEEFPNVRQTFNLVPSLLLQVEDYAEGRAVDPFLRCALKSAEELSEPEKEFILQYFFQANSVHLIGRYPRYAELRQGWRAADRNTRRALPLFDPSAMRDLQVLSQLAWFEEEFLEKDEEVKELVRKGRDYSLEDQALMGRKQVEILARVIPVYREFAARGQIEISATPYYHPILPLICDSSIAHEANPHVPLPSRFRYPEDARLQLERAREYVAEKIGVTPAGMWPSEGSVSDEALAIAAETGFRWAATDNGVLSRTLQRAADPATTYRPYLWQRGDASMHLIFRDHDLSDLVGFVYSRLDPADAARDFVQRIRSNSAPLLAAGRDALVPIILDGENAWEHYRKNGRPFLSELYRLISEQADMMAVTVSEALEKTPADPLTRIHPGSWINANFDVWIGFEEDNKAWERLLHARQAFDGVAPGAVPEQDRELALEELLIAEGSDWCWWYGPHHYSDNRAEFDQLYRDHLANVYRLLRLPPPAELSRPILETYKRAFHTKPVSSIHPTIDGEVTSYFEWMGAGIYGLDKRGGSMHGQRFLVSELLYGANRKKLYLRLDFVENAARSGMEVHVDVSDKSIRIRLRAASAEIVDNCGVEIEAAFKNVLEMALSFPSLGIKENERVRLQLSVWQGGLPMDALPHEGSLEIEARDVEEWEG